MFLIFAFIVFMMYMIEEFQKDDAQISAQRHEIERLQKSNEKLQSEVSKLRDKNLGLLIENFGMLLE